MEEIMTVKEMAEYLKVTPATIYKLARSGEMPAAKVASEWRFPKALVDDWLIERAGGKKLKCLCQNTITSDSD